MARARLLQPWPQMMEQAPMDEMMAQFGWLKVQRRKRMFGRPTENASASNNQAV
jgi:hypothetical protein